LLIDVAIVVREAGGFSASEGCGDPEGCLGVEEVEEIRNRSGAQGVR
jgi:hypothetical protein